MDATQEAPTSLNIFKVAKCGYYVADINYGGLGLFARITFNDEHETHRGLNWLEAVGAVPTPPWATTLQLATSYSQSDGPIQSNPCIVLSYATHHGCTEGQVVKAMCTLNGTLRYPNYNVNAIAVSYKWYVALEKDIKWRLNSRQSYFARVSIT